MTDYDRACHVENYLGLIDVGVGRGLILDDDPMPTTWYVNRANQKHKMLVRLNYTDDQTNIYELLSHLPDDIWRTTGIAFTANSEILHLFDAVDSGLATDDYLTIELAEGSYHIFTATYEPNIRTSLILHNFMC